MLINRLDPISWSFALEDLKLDSGLLQESE